MCMYICMYVFKIAECLAYVFKYPVMDVEHKRRIKITLCSFLSALQNSLVHSSIDRSTATVPQELE